MKASKADIARDPDRSFLDVLHDNRTDLVNISRDIRRLGSAFDATGNAAVADRLFGYGSAIETLSEEIVAAYGKKLSANLDESQRAVGETLRAILGPLSRTEAKTA